MEVTRKQIAFDLDTEALKKYYPTKNWRNAYEKIKRHMFNYDFDWRQGSVYISKEAMEEIVAVAAVSDLIKKNKWLNLCMRDCIVANIEKEYNLNRLFNKTVKINRKTNRKDD